jgi:hypothetical protein
MSIAREPSVFANKPRVLVAPMLDDMLHKERRTPPIPFGVAKLIAAPTNIQTSVVLPIRKAVAKKNVFFSWRRCKTPINFRFVRYPQVPPCRSADVRSAY